MVKERKLKILVSEDEIEAHNTETGVIWKVRKSFLGRKNEPHAFSYNLRDLSNTHSVEIILESESGKKVVDLPKELESRLIDFFQSQPETKGAFDCASFAHYLKGIPYEAAKFNKRKWKFKELKESNLQTGDVVFMSSIPIESTGTMDAHFAIYIDDDIYLSKFGKSGNLIFTSLEEMMKGFECEVSYHLIPKKKWFFLPNYDLSHWFN